MGNFPKATQPVWLSPGRILSSQAVWFQSPRTQSLSSTGARGKGIMRVICGHVSPPLLDWGPWEAGLAHLCKEQPGKWLQRLLGVLESDPALNPPSSTLRTGGGHSQLCDLGQASSPL